MSSFVKYQALVKVAELGSLTKAAATMEYSQPAISHMLSSLENEFGFPLFYKNGSSLSLTENGKIVAQHCTQIIKHEEELRNTVQSLYGLLTGTIKIGAIRSTLISIVPEIINMFTATYPNVKIELTEMTSEEYIQAVRSGSIDIAFTSDIAKRQLQFIPLQRDDFCLFVNKNHPFASYEKVSVYKLTGCNYILPSAGYDDPINILSKKYHVTPTGKYLIGSDTALISMVQHNLGVTIMSELQVNLSSDQVLAIPFEEDVSRILGIAVKPSHHCMQALKEFIKITIEKAQSDEYKGIK